MPSISVIVPVYKVENFLHRCVDSILAQTFEDFELILVDDGSPDNCGAICEEYARKDSRIQVIHQKNGGLSAARNAGIDWAFANSKSQWLSFVDSDDWIHPDFLKTLYTAVETAQCKIGVCGFYRTSGEAFPQEQETEIQCLTADEYYCGKMHGGTTAVAWNKLYHKSLFRDLRYPIGKLHEDEFTTYRAIYHAEKVAATPAQLYAYYQNPEGIMQSEWNPRRMHVLEAFEQQIAYAQETGKLRFLKKAVENYLFSVYEHLCKANVVYKKELRRKLRFALKLAQTYAVFPRERDMMWAYEVAYPMKPFWWLFFKIRALKK